MESIVHKSLVKFITPAFRQCPIPACKSIQYTLGMFILQLPVYETEF